MSGREVIRTQHSVLLVQRRIKGALVRTRLKVLKDAVDLIKATIKSMWLSHAFQVARAAARKIQRRFRAYRIKTREIQRQWNEFSEKAEGQLLTLKALEGCLLFGAENPELPKELEARFGALPFSLFNSLVYYSKMRTPEFLHHIKPISPFGAQKISFFTLVCDLHLLCDTTEIYKESWAGHWSSLCSDTLDSESPVLSIAVGTTHTLAVNAKSQLFSWGLNQYGQCGVAPSDEDNFVPYSRKAGFDLPVTPARIKSIATGHYHSLALDYEGNVYAWGCNQKGQKYEDVKRPQKMVHGFTSGEVKEIDACGDISVAVTKSGEAYIWPVIGKDKEYIACPTKIPLIEYVSIDSATCGEGFVMLLTTQGLLFSFGQSASEGQLGHGDTTPRSAPELIGCLKDAGIRIQTVSCGFKHVVAKSSLGKVYTWGWGGMGQLGHGGFECELSPRNLDIIEGRERDGPKKRAGQVAAGYSHTVILTESRQLYWFGTCSGLNQQPIPKKVPLEKLFPELFANRHILPAGAVTTTAGVALANTMSFFSPVRVSVSWSRTVSITSIAVLDMRSMGSNIATSSTTGATVAPSMSTVVNLTSQLNALAAKWNPKETEPPFIETIAGLFSANVMKKSKSGADKRFKPQLSYLDLTQRIKNALSKGIMEYGLQGKNKGIIAKVKEIEETLKMALDKDPEALSEREKQVIANILKNLSK